MNRQREALPTSGQKQIEVSPSILAANLSYLAEELDLLEKSGADRIHLDVMDGRFVPNITFGQPVVKAIDEVTDLPLEVHLMIEEPERYLESFAKAGADYLIVHAEAVVHLERCLAQIRALNCKAGVALNPSTPEEIVRYVLHQLDLILVMTVNPGFSGQKFIPQVLPKIEKLRELIESEQKSIDIAVDGGINTETAPAVIAAGANVLVAGSGIFGKARDKNYAARIAEIRSGKN